MLLFLRHMVVLVVEGDLEDALNQQRANIALPFVKSAEKSKGLLLLNLSSVVKDNLLGGTSLQEITDKIPRSLHI